MATQSYQPNEFEKKYLGKKIIFEGGPDGPVITGTCDQANVNGALVIIRSDGTRLAVPHSKCRIDAS